MAKKNSEDTENSENQSGGESKETNAATEAPKVKLIYFCDSQGVNAVDRQAVYMKFGKLTEKTEKEWIELLTTKITLKKTDK